MICLTFSAAAYIDISSYQQFYYITEIILETIILEWKTTDRTALVFLGEELGHQQIFLIDVADPGEGGERHLPAQPLPPPACPPAAPASHPLLGRPSPIHVCFATAGMSCGADM